MSMRGYTASNADFGIFPFFQKSLGKKSRESVHDWIEVWCYVACKKTGFCLAQIQSAKTSSSKRPASPQRLVRVSTWKWS